MVRGKLYMLGGEREVMRGMLSMDQSKLREEGQSRSQQFLAGRWRKVRLRVRREDEWEAGLSALEKEGRLPPRAAARRLRMATRLRAIWRRFFLLLPARSSRTAETPSTVTPCLVQDSFQSLVSDGSLTSVGKRYIQGHHDRQKNVTIFWHCSSINRLRFLYVTVKISNI